MSREIGKAWFRIIPDCPAGRRKCESVLKLFHTTGFSQWLMTNFISADFLQRKILEGTAPAVPKFAVGQEPDPPRKFDN